MICIRNENDLAELEKEPKPNILIGRFLVDYIKKIATEYSEYKMSSYGAFFFIENNQELKRHTEFHLSRPITETIIEFSEKIRVSNTSGDTVFNILHFCIIISNDFGVSIFVEDEVLDLATEQYLLEEQLPDRTVIIND